MSYTEQEFNEAMAELDDQDWVNRPDYYNNDNELRRLGEIYRCLFFGSEFNREDVRYCLWKLSQERKV